MNEVHYTLERVQAMSPAEQEELRHAFKTCSPFLLAEGVLRSPEYTPLTDLVAQIAEQFPIANENPAATWHLDHIHHVVVFRDAGKTTLIPVSIVQNILACPNIRILVFGSTQAAAMRIFEQVRRYLRHPVITYLFPEMADGKFSNGKLLSPLRTNGNLIQPTLSISSLESNSWTGWHGELLYCDDLLTDKKSYSSMAIAKAKEMFPRLLPLIAGEGGHLIHTCTRWSDDDLIADELEQQEQNPEFSRHFFIMPILRLRTDGNVTEQAERRERQKLGYDHLLESDVILACPELFDFDRVRATIAENPRGFASQYMLLTGAPSEIVVTEEMFKRALILPEKCNIDGVYATNWDLAGLSDPDAEFEHRDDHAGVTFLCARDRSGKHCMVITDIVCKKFYSPNERIDEMEEVYDHFTEVSGHRVFVRIENAHSIKDWLDPLLRERGIQATWGNPNSSRDKRIQNFRKGVAAGRVRITMDVRNRDRFEHQLLHWYPDSNMPVDILDSAAQAYEWWCSQNSQFPILDPPIKPAELKRQQQEEQDRAEHAKQAEIERQRLEEELDAKFKPTQFYFCDLTRAGITTDDEGHGCGSNRSDDWRLFCQKDTPAARAWFKRVMKAGVQPRRG